MMRSLVKNIFIYFFFFIVSVLYMFPVIGNMSTVMYGRIGDPCFRIWESWYFKYAFLNNKPFYFSDFIGAPFGADLSQIPYHLLWDKALFVMTLVTNEIFSYNFFIFLSFLLSGITMYYLAFYITKDRRVSLFSGFLFTICPYHLAHSVGHFELTNIQWLPMFIMCALKFLEKPSIRNALFASLSLSLVFISSYYYGVFSFIVFFVLLFLSIMIKKPVKILNLILLSVFILLFSGVITYIFILPAYSNTVSASSAVVQKNIVYMRPLKSLFTSSARPLSYCLPSYMHPIFGGFTRLFIGSPLYGESKGENSLYLGILPLLLSYIAIRQKSKTSKIFLYLLIACFILSMPPYIKLPGLFIPLPQYFIFRVLPMFRTYARFGIYCMLCIAVLSGLGLKHIIDRIPNNTKKYTVYSLCLIFVFFEFLVNPMEYKTDLRNPPAVYKWLAEQKEDFIISEYPINKNFDMRTDWLIWQRIHKKRKTGGVLPGSESDKMTKYILRLQDTKTPQILSYLGVKYVIIHLEDMKKSETLDVVGELPDFKKLKGLKFVKSFNDAEVYEVTAQPLSVKELKE